MSRTYRIVIVALVAAGAVGGYWKLLLAPKREEASSLARKVAVEESKLAQTQATLADYRRAQADYQKNFATVVGLGKAIPADDDTRSLMVQLDAAAKRSGVDFDNIDLSSATVAGGAPAAASTAPSTAPPGAVNAGTYSVMPFNFSFSGRFQTLSRLFSRIERFVNVRGEEITASGRLVRITGITVQPDDTGWPGLHAQVAATTYVVPQVRPVADAASATSAGVSKTTANASGETR